MKRYYLALVGTVAFAVLAVWHDMATVKRVLFVKPTYKQRRHKMPSWLPIEEGTEVPNGSEYRPDGGGGFEFSPNDVGVEPCANPIARFVNGQLTWECRVLTCPTSCHSYEWVEDPTNPDTKRVRCQCAEL